MKDEIQDQQNIIGETSGDRQLKTLAMAQLHIHNNRRGEATLPIISLHYLNWELNWTRIHKKFRK